MDTKAPRVPPTINMIVSFVVCVAFFHHLGVDLSPDGGGSWPEDDR
ncbi:hypothetical protein GCM10022252_78960 [Streptosporangium oxazolinicum]|uniref:Uncharacterized protein n=1 Tax=Streptosporangium oxazolinicum TaxID=909287 RepID=A0ABP8BMW5_9ACTN